MESILRSVSKSLAVVPPLVQLEQEGTCPSVWHKVLMSLPLALVVVTARAKVSPCRDKQGL